MARAFLKLYEATGDRNSLQHCSDAMHFIASNFRTPADAGFLTSRTPTDHAYRPHPQHDENVILARVANLLSYYTGDAQFRKTAEQAMRYLVTPRIANQYASAALLLTDSELGNPPLHLTVVGHKDDGNALKLYQAALTFPSGYKRVEWWDKREGKLPNADVDYPELKHAAAFVCTERSCSSPVSQPEQLLAKAGRLSR